VIAPRPFLLFAVEGIYIVCSLTLSLFAILTILKFHTLNIILSIEIEYVKKSSISSRIAVTCTL